MAQKPKAQVKAREFVGECPPFEEVARLSLEERSRLSERLIRANKEWLEARAEELGAAWLIVVDGRVERWGKSPAEFRHAYLEEACRKTGKFAILYESDTSLKIEEATWGLPRSPAPWSPTILAGDFYPTVPFSLGVGANGPQIEMVGDFDTGAQGVFLDLDIVLTHGLIEISPVDRLLSARHLGRPYVYLLRDLYVALLGEHAKEGVVYAVHCVTDWTNSPFVVVNPHRKALFGRGPCLEIGAVVHLDFRRKATEISFGNLS